MRFETSTAPARARFTRYGFSSGTGEWIPPPRWHFVRSYAPGRSFGSGPRPVQHVTLEQRDTTWAHHRDHPSCSGWPPRSPAWPGAPGGARLRALGAGKGAAGGILPPPAVEIDIGQLPSESPPTLRGESRSSAGRRDVDGVCPARSRGLRGARESAGVEGRERHFPEKTRQAFRLSFPASLSDGPCEPCTRRSRFQSSRRAHENNSRPRSRRGGSSRRRGRGFRH